MTFEALIKIGGSVAEDERSLLRLCTYVARLAEEHRIAIAPGGWRLADLVRSVQERFAISDSEAHAMALVAVDLFGLLLASLIPGATPRRCLGEARRAKLPIILPSKIVLESGLEESWRVTSDSIAAFLTGAVGAKRLVLVKDVDGVFDQDPKRAPKALLIREVRASGLVGQQTCVDEYLPSLLLRYRIPCFVVNGRFPERIERLLRGEPTICTAILPR